MLHFLGVDRLERLRVERHDLDDCKVDGNASQELLGNETSRFLAELV